MVGRQICASPPKSLKDLSWYNDTFFQMFADTLGLKANHLAGLCCLFGAFILRVDTIVDFSDF